MRLKLEQKEQGQKPVVLWSDYVDDLWKRHFPHLREEIIGEGLFDPTTDQYGFQEVFEDDALSDEFAVSLNDKVEEEEKLERGIEDIKLSDTGAIRIKKQEEKKTDGATLSGIG